MYINLEVEKYTNPRTGTRYRIVPTVDKDSPLWSVAEKYLSGLSDYSGPATNIDAYLLRESMSGNIPAKILWELLGQLKDCGREMATLYEWENEVDRRRRFAAGRASGLSTAKRVLRWAKKIDRLGTFPKGVTMSDCYNWTGCQPYHYVYFLIESERCVYVGQAKSLKNRLTGHADKEYDAVKYILVKPQYVDAVESAFIQRYRPKYNSSGGNAQGIPFSLWAYECEETDASIRRAIAEVFSAYEESKQLREYEGHQKLQGKKIKATACVG